MRSHPKDLEAAHPEPLDLPAVDVRHPAANDPEAEPVKESKQRGEGICEEGQPFDPPNGGGGDPGGGAGPDFPVPGRGDRD